MGRNRSERAFGPRCVSLTILDAAHFQVAEAWQWKPENHAYIAGYSVLDGLLASANQLRTAEKMMCPLNHHNLWESTCVRVVDRMRQRITRAYATRIALRGWLGYYESAPSFLPSS